MALGPRGGSGQTKRLVGIVTIQHVHSLCLLEPESALTELSFPGLLSVALT